jgi:putative FmdB family regulatory protein
MILYTYECDTCHGVFEVEQSLNDDKLTEYLCPHCQNDTSVHRIITGSNFKLVGNGWAKDGYSNERYESMKDKI